MMTTKLINTILNLVIISSKSTFEYKYILLILYYLQTSNLKHRNKIMMRNILMIELLKTSRNNHEY